MEIPQVKFTDEDWRDFLDRRARAIYAQRNEVMEAFIAKFGMEPERFVQVIQTKSDLTQEWFVRRRSNEEMLELSRFSAML